VAIPIVADGGMILHHEEVIVVDLVLLIACGVHPEALLVEDMAIVTIGIETGIATAIDITMKDRLHEEVVVAVLHEMTTAPVVEDVVTDLPIEAPWATVLATITEVFLPVLVVAEAMVAAVVLDPDHLPTVPLVVLLVVTMAEVDRRNIEIDACPLLDRVELGALKGIVIAGEVQNEMSIEEMIVDIAHRRNETKGRSITKPKNRNEKVPIYQ
jgi:hypothetical protein